MKLLELIIWQSCTYKCRDCPMEKWTYEPDELDGNGRRRNAVTNEKLLKWLDKYIDPKEWFLQITGGEPSEYPEINELIPALEERGYVGLIRTNGSSPLPESESFKRVMAWHKQFEGEPKYYDFVLILENPEDDWRGKEAYCREKGIPYAVFPYKFFSTGCSQTTVYPPKTNRFFQQAATVFASGCIGGCPTSVEDYEKANIFDMDAPEIADLCGMCGNVEALEYFICNAPGFMGAFGIKPEDILPDRFCITYPLLNEKSEWVDRGGNVVGVLGDDIDGVPRETVYVPLEEGRM